MFKFWPFHRHEYIIAKTTYAAPIEGGFKIKNCQDILMLERMYHGATTFIWKCSDEECSKMLVQVCVGKEIEE